jgi:DNA mismatch repair protein MutS
MSEAAEILRKATSKSLVILDEVGRGTSTTDGLAIATSIMEDLADRVKCFTMFATHYHELVPMMSARTNVVPVQTEVLEQNDGIVFTHRLTAGASASSFGLEVARLAGVPSHVIELAKGHLARFEQGELVKPEVAPAAAKSGFDDVKRAGGTKSVTKVQRGLFALASEEQEMSEDVVAANQAGLSRVVSRLEAIKIHKTTPLQALNILNELKAMLIPAHHRALFDEELHP